MLTHCCEHQHWVLPALAHLPYAAQILGCCACYCTMSLVLLPLRLMLASFSAAVKLLLRLSWNRLLKPAAVTVQPDKSHVLTLQ